MALAGFGALQLALTQRTADFVRGDVTYYELARSILAGQTYGFNARIETMLPPGFPAMLALLCVTVGCSYGVLIRAMPVFATLAFIVSYDLMRREVGRAVAAGMCFLLISSSEVFDFSTTLVFSDLPYFFASSVVLLLVAQLDERPRASPRSASWWLLCVLVPASVLLRSAGLTLLTGFVVWMAASSFFGRAIAVRRVRVFLPPLLLGLLAQGAWMEWGHRHEVSEWPIGGYPKSYFSQLWLESGNEPEQGRATPGDVIRRVARNAVDRATNVVDLLARRGGPPEWSSPVVLVTIGLVVTGVAASIIHGGGALHDWYYIGHEAMYLLWPWEFEERFFLPVIPLTCLYLWRGGQVLLRLAAARPRAFGRGLLPLALVLGAGSLAWLRRTGDLKAALALAFWSGLVALASWLAWADSLETTGRMAGWSERLRRPLSWMPRANLNPARAFGLVVLVAFVAWGLAEQLTIGQRNLDFDVTRIGSYPSIEAAKWLRTHSPETASVMARDREVVYHYAGRRVVWFPPISDPAVLMDGVRRHVVDLIVVTDGRSHYWRPTDRACFDRLRAAYPDAFTLVHEEAVYRIFSVSAAASRTAVHGASPSPALAPRARPPHLQPALERGGSAGTSPAHERRAGAPHVISPAHPTAGRTLAPHEGLHRETWIEGDGHLSASGVDLVAAGPEVHHAAAIGHVEEHLDVVLALCLDLVPNDEDAGPPVQLQAAAVNHGVV